MQSEELSGPMCLADPDYEIKQRKQKQSEEGNKHMSKSQQLFAFIPSNIQESSNRLQLELFTAQGVRANGVLTCDPALT